LWGFGYRWATDNQQSVQMRGEVRGIAVGPAKAFEPINGFLNRCHLFSGSEKLPDSSLPRAREWVSGMVQEHVRWWRNRSAAQRPYSSQEPPMRSPRTKTPRLGGEQTERAGTLSISQCNPVRCRWGGYHISSQDIEILKGELLQAKR
jgi:hypothetical protein